MSQDGQEQQDDQFGLNIPKPPTPSSQSGNPLQYPHNDLSQSNYAHLLSSPVRRMVYPQMYGGLQTTVNGLAPQLYNDLQRQQAISAEFERLTRQMVFLQEDNARLHQDNTTLVETLDQREISLDNCHNTVKERDQEIAELKAELMRKDANIVSCNNEIASLLGKVTQVETANDNLTNWNTKLTADQNDLTSRINERDARITALHKTVADYQTWNTKLMGDVKDYNRKIHELSSENDRLAAEIMKHKTEIGKLQGDVTELTSQLRAHNDEIERLEDVRRENVATIDDLTAQLVECDKKLNDCQATNKNLHVEIAGLKNQLADQLELYASLQEKCAELEKTNAALQDTCQALQAEKLGLVTTVMNKEQTIGELGANLTQIERDRLDLHNVAQLQQQQNAQLGTQLQSNHVLTNNLVGGGLGYGGMGGVYGGMGMGMGYGNPLGNSLLGRSYL